VVNDRDKGQRHYSGRDLDRILGRGTYALVNLEARPRLRALLWLLVALAPLILAGLVTLIEWLRFAR